mmetsp:Transcript_18476/g.33272  ORF Transcript_18476/g.33272 Transcript_18476/m.33272 type:complete len:156 (-) Transcript_18476:558-1025(-)
MRGTKKSAKRLKSLAKVRDEVSPEGPKKKAKIDENAAVVTATHPPEKRKKKKKKGDNAEEMYNDLLLQYHSRMPTEMVTPMKRKAADVVVGESSKKKQKVKFIMQRNTVLQFDKKNIISSSAIARSQDRTLPAKGLLKRRDPTPVDFKKLRNSKS